MDLSITKKAGITQAEFAWLVGVSRVTANRWLRTKTVHPMAVEKVTKVVAAIAAALDDAKFPLPGNLPTEKWKYGPVRPAVKALIDTYLN